MRDQLAVADVRFELELHEAEEWNRHDRAAFHEDAALAHVAGHHADEPRGPALIFPRQAGWEVDALALDRPFVDRPLRVSTKNRLHLHDISPPGNFR